MGLAGIVRWEPTAEQFITPAPQLPAITTTAADTAPAPAPTEIVPSPAPAKVDTVDLAAPAKTSAKDPQGFGQAFRETPRVGFVEFARWVDRYQQAPAAERVSTVDEGVQLAETRQKALREMIRREPQTALSLAVPLADRQTLPPPVVAKLEQRVSGTGRLTTLGVVPIPGAPKPKRPVVRRAEIKDREYDTFPAGKGETLTTVPELPMEGIAIESELALAEPPSKYFVGQASGDPNQGTDIVTGKPSPAWTKGAKKILLIRVDFSDLPGPPVIAPANTVQVTESLAAGLFNNANGISDLFAQASYGQASVVMNLADVTRVYRLPKTAAYYAQGDGTISYSGQIKNDANAMAAADYDFSQYARIGVVCSNLSLITNSRMGFAGVAEINGPNFLINGFFSFGVVAHEIGHTFGVYHANRWKPQDGSTVGSEAEQLANLFNGADGNVSVEYGDLFDIMGDGDPAADSRYHFNPWFKSILSWLPNTAVQTVQSSGTYRVYRHDSGSADLVNHRLALKIGRDSRREYWVSYRQQPYSNGSNITNGANVHYAYFLNRQSDLLVANNPGTSVNGAALQVGQSIDDAAAGIKITTLAKGGTTPDEYLDIQVELQPQLSFPTTQVEFESSASVATVTVNRQGSTTGTTTVDYKTFDGTGISGHHYTGGSGTLVWNDGDATPKTLTFPILPYPAIEGQANFTVQLANPVNAGIVNSRSIAVSIRPPGNVDNSYLTDLFAGGISAMAYQPDGKLIVVGAFGRISLAPENQWVALYIGRLLPTGKRDFTFSAAFDGTPNRVRIQPDGKILVSGIFNNANGVPKPRLARLEANGALDTTFTPPVFDDQIYDILLLPDGRIVVGGFFRKVNGQTCFSLCWLKPDGSVDALFNPANYGYPSGFGGIRTLALDPYFRGNGVRIIAGGYFADQSSTAYLHRHTSLLRINPDGSLDSTFEVGHGAHTRNQPQFAKDVNWVEIQPDGKILVGGEFTAFGNSIQKFLARINPDGSPDPTFNPGITAIGLCRVSRTFTQPDGKILIGGLFTKVNGNLNKYLARLSPDGTFDPTWDNGTNADNGTAYIPSEFLLKPDGKMLMSIGGPVYAPYDGTLRGLILPFTNSGVGGGYASATLYTGLPGQYGQAQFAATTATVAPSETLTLTVQRVGGSNGAVRVDYSTQAGTAVAGTDFAVSQGTLSWADGDAAPKTINISCPAGATQGRKLAVNLAIPSGGVLLGAVQQVPVTVSTTTGSF